MAMRGCSSSSTAIPGTRPDVAGPERPPDADLQAEHEQFIDGLDQANKVVLGGGWKPATLRRGSQPMKKSSNLELAGTPF
jgi:hypothetical protein